MRSRVKTFDIPIILLAAGLTFFAAYDVYMKPHGRTQVLIRSQAREWVFPFEAEETVVVVGPLGNTTVRLRENQAWIESSPCDNQNCVVTGRLFRHGQWAACLPNNVLLVIQGTQENDIDDVVW